VCPLEKSRPSNRVFGERDANGRAPQPTVKNCNGEGHSRLCQTAESMLMTIEKRMHKITDKGAAKIRLSVE